MIGGIIEGGVYTGVYTDYACSGKTICIRRNKSHRWSSDLPKVRWSEAFELYPKERPALQLWEIPLPTT